MNSIWSFLKKRENRTILSWIGGGMVVVAGGLWVVVTFLWPDHSPTVACAQQSSIAAGHNASGNVITVTNTGGAVPGNSVGSVACADAAKK